jgi:hypothetical protein
VSLSTVIVLAHALVAVGFIVGLVGRWMILGAAARSTDLSTMRTLTAAAGPFEQLVIVGSSVVLVLGLVAAFAEGRSVLGPITGGSVDWLFVSLVLFLSIMPLIPLVFLPRGKVFGAALAEADRQGVVTPELQLAWHDPVTRAAHLYELGAVTVILCLMLAKPF